MRDARARGWCRRISVTELPFPRLAEWYIGKRDLAQRFVLRLKHGQGYGIYKPGGGPFKPPYKESMGRLPPSDGNWYYEFEDFLTERSKGKKWTWCEVRPDAIVNILLLAKCRIAQLLNNNLSGRVLTQRKHLQPPGALGHISLPLPRHRRRRRLHTLPWERKGVQFAIQRRLVGNNCEIGHLGLRASREGRRWTPV